MRPFDPMARVRRDVQIVTGLELTHLGLAFEAQTGAAGQEHDPFRPLLVPPKPGWTCLPGRDDALDAHIWRREQRGDVFISAAARKSRKQISARRDVSHGSGHADLDQRARIEARSNRYFFTCFLRNSSARGHAALAAASL